MGNVHSIDPCEAPAVDAAEPIEGVTVTSDDGAMAFTDSTGGYELEDVRAGRPIVTFAKTGFLTFRTSVDLDCGEDEVLDAELLCLGKVGFKVVASIATDEDTSSITGATVAYSKPLAPKVAHYGTFYRTSGTTNAAGVATLTVPILNATGTFEVSALGIAETGTFTWTQMVNTPTSRPTLSIFGGKSLNSCVDAAYKTEDEWYGFDDDSCLNIGEEYVKLNNQDVELVLCGYGTVAGRVTVAANPAVGRLVEVIQDGVVVGSDTTDASGVYIISGIPTRCFTGVCPKTFTVRCMGWTKSENWEGCGDVERVGFPF